jgi:TRAP-type mannitol/chloroaromatic compound transport system permease small subunit
MNRFLFMIDRLSAWSGKAFAWTIVLLTLIVCYDVFARYLANSPTDWGFDAAYILYGVLFMMAGAYTLSRNGHVRADMMYRSLQPRTQATIDLVLYFAWAQKEVSSVTAAGTPIYPFKLVIPIAGVLLLLQGIAEIVRCIITIRTGRWPQRLHDVEEEDVEQLKDILGGGEPAGSKR